jgi:hypothetical protein
MKNPTEYDGVRQQSEAAFLPPSLVDVGFLLVADVSRSHQPSVNFNEDGAVAIH